MSFYRYPSTRLMVFFGGQQESFVPADYRHMLSAHAVDQPPFAAVAQTMELEQLVFLHQTHGIQGAVVGTDQMPIFEQEGDFLITRTPHVGIAVATADCVPLVIYSTMHPVIGIVHAGWRGTVSGIMYKALDLFLQEIGGDKQSIRVVIGPSARLCCYEVDQSFMQHLAPGFEVCLQERAGKLFFDAVAYNTLLITQFGLHPDAIQDTGICTMHEQGYCSHRASGGRPERQYTVVALK